MPSISRTEAARKDGKYVLNGAKMFISNAPVADSVLVFASVDRTKGMQGISAFIVEKARRASASASTWKKWDCAPRPWARSCFRTVKFRKKIASVAEGAGVAIFNCSMEWERGSILANYLGTMQRQIEVLRQVMPASVSSLVNPSDAFRRWLIASPI